MKRWTTATLTVLLSMLAGMFFSNTTMAQPQFHTKGLTMQATARNIPGEIVVKFHPGVSDAVIKEINRGHGANVLSTSRFAGFKRLRVPKGKTVAEMVAIYRHNPNVEYAEPNFIAQAFAAPNDSLYYPYQWHMDNGVYGGIHLNAAREISTGAQAVIIAVIDTGAAYENYTEGGVPIGRSGKVTGGTAFAQAPDLAGTHFVAGYDFVNNDTHPNDDEGHGTHVTGTIAQTTDNNVGTAGIAPDCSIMPVKVLDSSGSGSYTAIADGIYFAADNGAKVINMSLGGAYPSTTLESALAYAYGQGVTIVCASGNDSATTVSYPAAYDSYCIAVGATRYDEEVAWYSNQGSSLDLTAPGGDVDVDQNGDGYGDGVLQQTHDGSDYTTFGYYFYQGTSMATPHVAGVAALLIANGVANTPDEVRTALQATAEDHGATGWDSAYGWGIVDAVAALQYGAVSNHMPVANAGGPYSADEDATLAFDGSDSTDADNDPLTYSWTFGDGASGSGVAPSHTYSAGGTYTVTLTVNDGKTDSTVATTSATIVDVNNDAPVADAGPDQEASEGQPVYFDGSASFDEEGSSLIYEWDFGDGATSTSMTPTHAYSTAGNYTVTLTVKDDTLLPGTDTATVTVSPQTTQTMHVEPIAMVLKKAGLNTSALATVTVLAADDSPMAGATVSGQWSGATSDTDTGITDTNGQVTLVSDNVKRVKSNTTYTFTLNGITLTGWSYTLPDPAPSGSITVP